MNFSDAATSDLANAAYMPQGKSVQVVLALGSNRSFNGKEPPELLRAACSCLSEKLGQMKYSSVYKTAAMYYENQPDFYNMVVSGCFCGTATELLDFTQSIEAKFGRNRAAEFRNGPRPLDIDIELFGAQKICTERLQVPHPRLHERAFVLVPMLEIFSSDAESIIDRKYLERCLETLQEQRIQKLPLSIIGE